ncbi:hypothetical protein CEE69_01520 [Rhodopirellula bahusiensis]|uniref:Uncharacterized protein n=1 Tax=Rhodopirellula bahusiensis TaxID=2014065 RepID=A0A2G1WE22_9BACT|nr:hypothetical protein CEE69_01520 [Rhodopirellula bahusiensis]
MKWFRSRSSRDRISLDDDSDLCAEQMFRFEPVPFFACSSVFRPQGKSKISSSACDLIHSEWMSIELQAVCLDGGLNV